MGNFIIFLPAIVGVIVLAIIITRSMQKVTCKNMLELQVHLYRTEVEKIFQDFPEHGISQANRTKIDQLALLTGIRESVIALTLVDSKRYAGTINGHERLQNVIDRRSGESFIPDD